MLYIWLTLLVIVNGFWWSLTFFSLPGNWLIVLTTWAFAWWRWEQGIFSVFTLAVITLLAITGEVIELFAGMGGAKKAGAGRRGVLGALLGAVVGAVVGTFFLPIPFVGTLVGASVGAGIGAWSLELTGNKKMEESVRLGVGAGLGVLLGTGSKVVIGVIICVIVAVTAFWP